MVSEQKRIPSPCIMNCCLDDNDICLGCYRSLSEVIGWADADNAKRQKILDDTVNRKAMYREKYRA